MTESSGLTSWTEQPMPDNEQSQAEGQIVDALAMARAFAAEHNMRKQSAQLMPTEEVLAEALQQDHGEKITDDAKVAIRENIKSTMTEAGAAISDKMALPEEYIPGTEALRGKKIVMVDDEVNVVLQSIQHGAVATNGNFEVVLHKEEADTADRLADMIVNKSPDLVIIDHDLAFGVTGVEVVLALREKGYHGKIVGSSQKADNAIFFLEVDVLNSYDKLFKLGPEEEMRGLAAVFKE